MRHRDRRGDLERRRDAGRDSEPTSKAEPWAEQHHAHGHRGRGGRGGSGRGSHRRARAQRGDVRTAVLLVLADEPMHGYQIMQAMSDRTGGGWRASPGAVYPTIAQLEDEGLVTTREEGGRRLVTLTSDGRTYLEERSARLGDPFADFADQPSRPDLREPMQELQAAARQIVVSGSTAQVKAAAQVLAQTRRSLYLILAGEPEDAGERSDD
jgi:DNA-binding PadR family transcriptional regulator